MWSNLAGILNNGSLYDVLSIGIQTEQQQGSNIHIYAGINHVILGGSNNQSFGAFPVKCRAEPV